MLMMSMVSAAALVALQADPSGAARDAYTGCLRTFMEKSVQEKTSADDFTAALPRQCTSQETAYREAVRSREQRYKTPAAEVDEIIKMELDDARANIQQIFDMSTTPS